MPNKTVLSECQFSIYRCSGVLGLSFVLVSLFPLLIVPP